tara:strand:- start:90 stop:989 length:900 start_codon:yes stop_codon:yes gene_type:complete
MSGAGESKHTEESAAASVAAQNKNPTLEDYGKALDILERIFYLLHDLDYPKRGSDFKSNQKEIKKLVLKLYNSNLPLKKGNIATFKKKVITAGGRGTRSKNIWAIVGDKKENPFKRQADGSYGIGENSLFSVNSENPEDITQNMPTGGGGTGDGNDYGPSRFNAYGEAVKHIKDEVINFMEELPGGRNFLIANSGGKIYDGWWWDYQTMKSYSELRKRERARNKAALNIALARPKKSKKPKTASMIPGLEGSKHLEKRIAGFLGGRRKTRKKRKKRKTRRKSKKRRRKRKRKRKTKRRR